MSLAIHQAHNHPDDGCHDRLRTLPHVRVSYCCSLSADVQNMQHVMRTVIQTP